MNASSLLGKGVYSVPEAARIVHTDARSIRRWINGYESPKTCRYSPRILITEVVRVDDIQILTFQQLIEVMFIKLFREYEVSMPTIRAAAKRASEIFDNSHPFAVKGLQTDGKDIFHLTEEQVIKLAGNEEPITKKQIAQDLKNGQMVLVEIAQPYFHKIDYDKLEAARYWPLGKDRSIVIDPQRSFGQPIDAATRVPTKTLYEMYKGDIAHEDGLYERISKWYGVKQEAVSDAVEYEISLLKN